MSKMWYAVRKRLHVPKFYHGHANGIQFHARAYGFWRRWTLVGIAPYLFGESIKLNVKLKREEKWWTNGLLKSTPPCNDDVEIIGGEGTKTYLSESRFNIPPVERNKSWSTNIVLKDGRGFRLGDYQIYLALSRVSGNQEEESEEIKVADIDVISRSEHHRFVVGIVVTALITFVATVLSSPFLLPLIRKLLGINLE